MSVKEIKTYSDNSTLDINTIEAKSGNYDVLSVTSLIPNEMICDSGEFLNLKAETVIITGNTSSTYNSAYQLSLVSQVPSIIDYKTTTEITALISTMTMNQMKGGIIVGNGSAIFKTNIDTAANLFASLNLLNNQCIQVMCVNKSAFQWNFDTLDPLHVFFNYNSLSTPAIPAGQTRVMYVHFVGSSLNPLYQIYL